MPRRIVAHPEGGFPGKIEDGGIKVQGFYKLVALVYERDEVPQRGLELTTIAELRAKYWNPSRLTLVIPSPGGRRDAYEFGPELLRDTTDATVVHVRPEFVIPGNFASPRAATK